jgi:glucose/arabinose dehydrogenase
MDRREGYFAAVRKIILGMAGAALLVLACQAVLPERYAINVPLRSLLGQTVRPSEQEVLGRLVVPDGFSIAIFAEVRGARALRFTQAGDLLVSTNVGEAIVLVEPDADGDGRSDGQREVLDDLNRPYGLDFHAGWLYVGETDAVGRVRFDAEKGTAVGPYVRIVTGIPDGGHWTRTVRFGEDGLLYLTVGSSCNVCDEEDPRRAAIVRYGPDGSGEELYATGLRNAVGIDWRPATGELFANDNGRDLLGDDFPPCELNRVVRGGFYGWPVASGDNVPDPDMGEGQEERIASALPPVHHYAAHNAPLGLTFVRGRRVPADFSDAALSALHGSWNRTKKDGYKVVSLHWDADGDIEERDFISGFEIDEDVIGRPVDIAEGPDGAFYVSDDYAGLIYRVTWHGADG